MIMETAAFSIFQWYLVLTTIMDLKHYLNDRDPWSVAAKHMTWRLINGSHREVFPATFQSQNTCKSHVVNYSNQHHTGNREIFSLPQKHSTDSKTMFYKWLELHQLWNCKYLFPFFDTIASALLLLLTHKHINYHHCHKVQTMVRQWPNSVHFLICIYDENRAKYRSTDLIHQPILMWLVQILKYHIFVMRLNHYNLISYPDKLKINRSLLWTSA